MKKIILTTILIGISFGMEAQSETVNGNLTINGLIKLNNGNTDLLIYRDGDVGDWSLLRTNKGNGIGLIGKPDQVALSVSRTTNNVGIGTKSPDKLLTIKANKYLGWEYTGVGSGSYHTITGGGINPMSFTVNPFSANNPIFKFNGNTGTKVTILNGGNVGIGTTSPSAKLDVNGDIKANSISSISTGDSNIPLKIISDDGSYLAYARQELGGYGSVNICNQSGVRRITLLGSGKASFYGNVGIGTTDTKGFKLGVNGKIAANEVKVATYSNWADFVFKKDYHLPTLIDVENHIKEKGHLKDIPSAKEVEKNGFFLGEMDAKLLQKIEELTLYTIDQQKEIEELKKQNSEIKELKALIQKLLKDKN